MKLLFKILLSIIIMLVCFIIYTIFFDKLIPKNREYEANLCDFGYMMTIREVRHDTVLLVKFDNVVTNERPTEISVHNGSFDIVSFVLKYGVDSIFIRKNIDFFELVSPDKRKNDSIAPSWYKVYDPVIGKLPSKCRRIPYSDSHFFVYDSTEYNYIPKCDEVHIIKIAHMSERANYYVIYDITQNDVEFVPLTEK